MGPRTELFSIIVNIPSIILVSIGLGTHQWKEYDQFSIGLYKICFSKTNLSGCHDVTKDLSNYSGIILGCRYTIISALCVLFLVVMLSIVFLCKWKPNQTTVLRVTLTFGFVAVSAIGISTIIFWIKVLPNETSYSLGWSMICVTVAICLKLLETILYFLIAACCLENFCNNEVSPVNDALGRKGPYFRIPPADLAVIEGQDIVLKFEAENTDRVTWSKDNIRLTAVTDRATYLMDSSGCGSLRIAKAQQKDTGEYKCEAISSSFRSAVSTCTVSVHPAKPVFITKPENKKLEYGEKLSLSCEVEFAETVKWLRNNEEITADKKKNAKKNRMAISFLYNVATLSINNVTIQDAGAYRCLASSWGNCPKETIVECNVEVTGDVSPDFPERPDGMKVIEGRPLTISLKVLGYPRPKISWYKNDERIEADTNTVMKTPPGQAILKLHRTSKEDDGQYKCCAVNEYGNEIVIVPVRVESEHEGIVAECPVCQDRVPDTVLPCGHPLCSSCALEIQRMNSECPICRVPFREPSRLYLN